MKTSEIIDAFVDAAKCPLCGEDNRCQNICGDTDKNKNCWCKNLKFPQPLLEAIPVEARNKACICKQCATRSTN